MGKRDIEIVIFCIIAGLAILALIPNATAFTFMIAFAVSLIVLAKYSPALDIAETLRPYIGVLVLITGILVLLRSITLAILLINPTILGFSLILMGLLLMFYE